MVQWSIITLALLHEFVYEFIGNKTYIILDRTALNTLTQDTCLGISTSFSLIRLISYRTLFTYIYNWSLFCNWCDVYWTHFMIWLAVIAFLKLYKKCILQFIILFIMLILKFKIVQSKKYNHHEYNIRYHLYILSQCNRVSKIIYFNSIS